MAVGRAVPHVPEELGDRVPFKQGVFNDVGLDAVDLYKDGLIVSAQSPTSLLDEFLVDVCSWMASYLGLKRVETHTLNKNYESHIVVRSGAPVMRPLNVQAMHSPARDQFCKVKCPPLEPMRFWFNSARLDP